MGYTLSTCVVPSEPDKNLIFFISTVVKNSRNSKQFLSSPLDSVIILHVAGRQVGSGLRQFSAGQCG
jgi:hypothetical protein